MPVGASPGDASAAAIKSGVGPRVHPIVDAMQLVVAAVIGFLRVTVVQKETRREKPLSRLMEHAQVLLCVSGAMMMISIVGDSLARAFGIAGPRDPLPDPGE